MSHLKQSMPTVRKLKRWLGKSQVEFKIRLGSNDNLFRIQLPDNMRMALGINELTGETLVIVENALIDACNKFESSTGIEEKVILYCFVANITFWKPTEINGGRIGETCEFNRSDFYSRGEKGETTLKFGYFVMKKHTFAGNVRYYKLHADILKCLDGNSNYGSFNSYPACYFDDYKEMPWSEHREAFFKNALENFQQLIIRLMNFIELDHGEAAKLVDRSPVTGLLGSGEP